METHFDKGVTHFQKGIHCFAVVKSQRPVISFTINLTLARYRNEFLFERELLFCQSGFPTFTPFSTQLSSFPMQLHCKPPTSTSSAVILIWHGPTSIYIPISTTTTIVVINRTTTKTSIMKNEIHITLIESGEMQKFQKPFNNSSMSTKTLPSRLTRNGHSVQETTPARDDFVIKSSK